MLGHSNLIFRFSSKESSKINAGGRCNLQTQEQKHGPAHWFVTLTTSFFSVGSLIVAPNMLFEQVYVAQ